MVPLLVVAAVVNDAAEGMRMKTYPVISDHGKETPIFQVDNALISVRTVMRLLMEVDGVNDAHQRKVFERAGDIHARFTYLGRPFIVWEPYGDNSRYWIGPADMVEGEPAVVDPPNIEQLKRPFEDYRPWLHRSFFGDLLRVFRRERPTSKGER
jgi:hypothetical protein